MQMQVVACSLAFLLCAAAAAEDCPDGQCGDGLTCCRHPDKGYECCPLDQAVCCSDGAHCCPRHYKCSESRNACVRDDDVVIPWYPKLPALSNLETASDKDVKCPDGRRCSEHNSCCQLASGEYGCCALENAVCCSDMKHCCPADYSCDSTGICHWSVVLEVDFVPLTPAKSEPERCGQDECPEDKKCCRNHSMFHCCQYKDGVCCDGGYCCPSDQSCDRAGGCISNSVSFWDKWPFFSRRVGEDPLTL